jgi:hypothetical protein
MLNLSSWLIEKEEANKMIIILMKNHHNDQVKMLNWDAKSSLRDCLNESLESRSKSIPNRIRQQSRSLFINDLLDRSFFFNQSTLIHHCLFSYLYDVSSLI